MNRLEDKEILKAILISEKSIYSLEQTLKKENKESNYATVWRRIKKMQKDGLLNPAKTLRKNGKVDERGTMSPELTYKGLVKLLIEGDSEKDELIKTGQRILARDFEYLPPQFLIKMNLEEIYANTFSKMKPKVNLKFFDEAYVSHTLIISFMEALSDALPRIRRQEAVGIKATAEKMKRKYVQPSQVNGLRNIQRVLVADRDKFTHYVRMLDALIDEASRK